MCAVSLGAAAQSTITYPYNPDGNADALIGVTDLQDMLSVYGGAFSPSEIQIDGVGLGEVLTQLLTTQAARPLCKDKSIALQTYLMVIY